MGVQVGDLAPGFQLPDQDGRVISLAGYLGRKVVIYFYPRDDTPGCTTEACQFNDVLTQLAALGAEVVGISTDDARSHLAFRTKYNLTFTLLSDVDHAVHDLYGSWGEKEVAGRQTIGTLRTTFLVGADGRVLKVWRQVKPDGHAAEVMEALGAA